MTLWGIISNLAKRSVRPIKNFNVERRLDRVLTAEKPAVAPRHSSPDQGELVGDEIHEKDPKLAEHSTKFDIKSSVQKDGVLPPGKTYGLHTARPLPKNYNDGLNVVPPPPMEYGFNVPDVVPPGKLTMRLGVEMIRTHQTEQTDFTELAATYSISPELAENIVTHFKLFHKPEGSLQFLPPHPQPDQDQNLVEAPDFVPDEAFEIGGRRKPDIAALKWTALSRYAQQPRLLLRLRAFSVIGCLNPIQTERFTLYKKNLLTEFQQLTQAINSSDKSSENAYVRNPGGIKTISSQCSVRSSVQRWQAIRPIVELIEELDVILKTDQELAEIIQNITGGAEAVFNSTQDKDVDPEEAEMLSLASHERGQLERQRESVENELVDALIPLGECDKVSSVSMEFVAGAGGLEAGLFASELVRMYGALANQKGWSFLLESGNFMQSAGECSSLDQLSSDASLSRCLVKVDATGTAEEQCLFSWLKYEGGVHRVQRVPTTSKLNKIHTSTCAVVVMPVAEEVDLSVREADLKWDTFRASGAGGQHVNKTDSAVRLTHIPTGTVIVCQRERSLIQNKAIALKMLEQKLLAHILYEQSSQYGSQRRSQIGTLERSDKIRTYNYQQDRVTDHRLGVTWNSIDRFMRQTTHLQDALSQLHKHERLLTLLDFLADQT